MELDVIYNQDCLEGMAKLPDACIDMILCDLPYGTTACKWDVIIPFEPLWTEYKRLIKDNGAIVLFANEPFASELRMSNIKNYKYDWIWLKNTVDGFLNAKCRPLKKTENIVVFSKKQARAGGDNMQYYPQNLIAINRKITERKRNNDEHAFERQSRVGKQYTQQYTNYPINILEYPRESKSIHSTQKPVALLEYLIKTYTNEGDVVLDSCIGSGSTLVAAVNTNRHYIGFELDPKYFDIACKRLDDRIKPQALEEKSPVAFFMPRGGERS